MSRRKKCHSMNGKRHWGAGPPCCWSPQLRHARTNLPLGPRDRGALLHSPRACCRASPEPRGYKHTYAYVLRTYCEAPATTGPFLSAATGRALRGSRDHGALLHRRRLSLFEVVHLFQQATAAVVLSQGFVPRFVRCFELRQEGAPLANSVTSMTLTRLGPNSQARSPGCRGRGRRGSPTWPGHA